jgi:hypothetical protein
MFSKVKIRSLPFRIVRIVLLLAATLLFLMVTNPSQVPAILLVPPFMAIFATVYLLVMEIIRFFQPLDGFKGWAVYRPRLLAAIIAAFPVLLLVLQSIMELNHWDVLIALMIFLLAYVFVSRGSLPASRQ